MTKIHRILVSREGFKRADSKTEKNDASWNDAEITAHSAFLETGYMLDTGPNPGALNLADKN